MRVAVIGCGGLGGALARGLAQESAWELALCDHSRAKMERAGQGARCVIALEDQLEAAVAEADVVLGVVKPGGMVELFRHVAEAAPRGALLVSCAAGVPLATLAAAAPEAPVARAMPNIGARCRAATTGLVLGARTDPLRHPAILERIFSAIGAVRVLDDEEDLHAVTALAGSGPAFLLLALEAMQEAGAGAGLPAEAAEFFAQGALRAAAKLLEEEGAESAAALRAQITSPGGTTSAGLRALVQGGLVEHFQAAVGAAVKRSQEMAAAAARADPS